MLQIECAVTFSARPKSSGVVQITAPRQMASGSSARTETFIEPLRLPLR